MNIAVFASGNGTNFEAIAKAIRRGYIKANLALLVCDNPAAFVIKRAKRLKIKSVLIDRNLFSTKNDFEKEIIRNLRKEKVSLIILAGFMRLLSPGFVALYRNKIINIHPAILPSFKGIDSIKKAYEYGCKVAGVTVHFVDEKTDHGPIILQEAVKIKTGMSLSGLERRIHRLEHKLYPLAVKLFVEGELKVRGRRVILLS
jgi:phosphoribosylglycinamide formyltransferase-1